MSRELRTETDSYVPSFALLCERIGLSPEDLDRRYLTIPTEFFRFLLSELARTLAFEEDAYRKANPDVDFAVNSGAVVSCLEHFAETGYFEGRSHGEIAIDEEWYLSEYPDVAAAFEDGCINNVEVHFNNTGSREGRVSSELQLRSKLRWDRALECE